MAGTARLSFWKPPDVTARIGIAGGKYHLTVSQTVEAWRGWTLSEFGRTPTAQTNQSKAGRDFRLIDVRGRVAQVILA